MAERLHREAAHPQLPSPGNSPALVSVLVVTLAAFGTLASERPAAVAPGASGDGRSGVSAAAGQTAAADFPDRRLREALEEALGKEPGAAIAPAEVAALRSLDLRGRRIASLAGLELATNLATLELSENAVNDISPLGSLARLAHLDLDGNPVYDVTPLSGLVGLTFLGLANTKVRDLSPLTGLFRLEGLRVGGPLLSELEPLTEIPRLRFLQIRGAPMPGSRCSRG